ncbi:hypothetical protein FSP39_021538 [Pinctada imbricata]|uniref:Uncharacterized protein n=1 Tax=Pinctada imbricata TaxID=66713 RepID=A0AA88YEJ8_PINIB|nr:hypothetical protein FSP39_021538 [Pinctada imbricata]
MIIDFLCELVLSLLRNHMNSKTIAVIELHNSSWFFNRSAGIIAAIVIGCLVPIIIIAVICACVCCAASRRNTTTTGVVYTSPPAGVTTVTSASASQMVATPAYPGQPAPVYNVQGGFSGQVNAGYSQPPPHYEVPKY